MNINYRQPQFELFPSNAEHSGDTDKPRYLLAKVTLSIENLVILLVLCIMLAVLAFALGVEQGKRIAFFDQASRVSSRGTMTQTAKSNPIKTQPAKVVTALKTSPNTGVPTTATTQKLQGVVQPATSTGSAVAAIPVVTAPVAFNAVGAKPYTIQVASYKDMKFAQREAANLKARGWETQAIQKGSYVILCVGNFATRQEADDFARRLRPTYKDYVVRRL